MNHAAMTRILSVIPMGREITTGDVETWLEKAGHSMPIGAIGAHMGQLARIGVLEKEAHKSTKIMIYKRVK